VKAKVAGVPGSNVVVGIGRRIWVGGDEVAEVFVKEKIVGLDAGLPFLMSVVNGDAELKYPSLKSLC